MGKGLADNDSASWLLTALHNYSQVLQGVVPQSAQIAFRNEFWNFETFGSYNTWKRAWTRVYLCASSFSHFISRVFSPALTFCSRFDIIRASLLASPNYLHRILIILVPVISLSLQICFWTCFNVHEFSQKLLTKFWIRKFSNKFMSKSFDPLTDKICWEVSLWADLSGDSFDQLGKKKIKAYDVGTFSEANKVCHKNSKVSRNLYVWFDIFENFYIILWKRQFWLQSNIQILSIDFTKILNSSFKTLKFFSDRKSDKLPALADSDKSLFVEQTLV